MSDGLVRLPAEYVRASDLECDVVACTTCGGAGPVPEGTCAVAHKEWCPTLEGEAQRQVDAIVAQQATE